MCQRAALPRSPTDIDRLVEVVARLDLDGGMPGKTITERVLATLLALLALSEQGNGADAGPFRLHVRRMMEFLNNIPDDQLKPDLRELTGRVLSNLGMGTALQPGPWLDMIEDMTNIRRGFVKAAQGAIAAAVGT